MQDGLPNDFFHCQTNRTNAFSLCEHTIGFYSEPHQSGMLYKKTMTHFMTSLIMLNFGKYEQLELLTIKHAHWYIKLVVGLLFKTWDL